MLSADDRLDILDLLAATAQAIDARDGNALVTMFTADGLYETGVQSAHNVNQIASFATRQSRTGLIRRHTQTTTIEELDEGRALATSYVLVTEVVPGPRVVVVASGMYSDEVVRTEEGWRLHHRRGTADGEWSEMI